MFNTMLKNEKISNIKLKPFNKISCQIDPYWLSGFIDAEGCFYVGIIRNNEKFRVLPKLFLGHSEEIICKQIQNIINGGFYRPYKNIWRYELSSLKDHNKLINLLPELRTRKQKTYEYYKSIIELMNKKQHLTDQGVKLIRENKLKMNLK